MFPHYKYVNLDSDYLDVFSGELLEELKAEGKEVTEKDNIYNHWLDSSSPSSCAYWALSKPLGSEGYDRHLEHYAFCKDDQIDLENYTLSENEVIFVCGEEYIDLGFDDEEDDEDAHYLPQWEKFTSIEEAKEFKKTLCQDRRMMVFSIKNDILPEAIKKKEERDEAYRRYQQRKVFFKGDIIITDPCYVLNREDLEEDDIPTKYFFSYEKEEIYPDYDGNSSAQYQEEKEYYDKMNALWKDTSLYEENIFFEDTEFLNFKHHTMESSTLYGDWSCHVFDTETDTPIGEFCADSGMVCVYNMEDVLKYRPDFMDYLKDRPWIATIIKDFDGYVQFEINNGNLHVCGYGNKNFKSYQTGL